MTEQAVPPQQPPAGAPVPPEPEKKSTGKKVLGIVAIIVVALVVGGLKFGLRSWLDRDKTAEAKVGDCVAKLPEVGTGEQKEAPEAKVVDCTSTDAAYKVAGRVENQTEASAKTNDDCRQYVKDDGDYYVYSSIKSGGTGYLLCLTPKA